MRREICLLALSVALSQGCTEGANVFVEDAPDQVLGNATDATQAEESAELREVSEEGVALDLWEREWVDDADMVWQPGPGEAGFPCKSGTECNDGFCIETGDGMKCTKVCEDECPFEWECTIHTPSLPDQVSICVPGGVDLCRPCTANADCWTGGVNAGEACVSYGPEGFFCGAACGQTQDCSKGYECLVREDSSGELVLQCVLASGVCECKQSFIDEQAGTSCYAENEWGECKGGRSCKASGLTACDALMPEEEVCNGKDDDCDGAADEGLGGGECLVENQWGKCKGVESCTGGKLSCDGDDAAPEICDGLDNDCDGQTDEGFPDTNQDGVKDCLVSDKDGDGMLDIADNCPAVPNPGQADFDLDGDGDACDLDDDNDLVADLQDCSPMNPDVSPKAVEKCNGVDDDCDLVVDEGFPDTDFDKLSDCMDDDDDGDGTADTKDCEPLNPAVSPAAVEKCNGLDDNCAGGTDEGFKDSDLDGIADCVDSDVDGDGAKNEADNCPSLPNAGQEDLDKDGIGDACDPDVDGDAIPNATDNCPLVGNAMQADTDSDGDGDACDGDDDGDGDPDEADCAPLVATINHAAQEVCDKVDNDCDAQVDEELGSMPCGAGECTHQVPNCKNGAPGFCNPFIGAKPEQCDGLDNDCDGIADEDLGVATCGLGQCWKQVEKCAQGKPQACDSLEGATYEVCDGLDNDCDGKTDEDQPQLACGVGQCFHTEFSCIGGVTYECNPFKGATKEVCDGQDNDCDGKVDEDLGKISCGLGLCLHSVDACSDGAFQPCNPIEGAAPEACDKKDNDCDGLVDEDFGVIQCGLGQCKHDVKLCLDGQIQECNPLEGAVAEECDGKDNDCDGLIDEELGSTACGVGECVHSTPNCKSGVPQECNPLEGASPEVCDGKDNNCDGKTDEGHPDTDKDKLPDCIDPDDDNDGDPDDIDCAPLDATIHSGAPEVCFNGKDDDCNPVTLDDCLLASCYAIHQAKPNLPSAKYKVDPTGGDSLDAFEVECDMSTDGGGWNVVNSGHLVYVGTRHALKEWQFKVSDFGYSAPAYKFSDVYVNMKFAGELDDDVNYINMYFNGQFVNKWKNGACNVDFVQIGEWPRKYSPNDSQFKLGIMPEGDVDADCGNGQPYGIDWFELIRFRVVGN